MIEVERINIVRDAEKLYELMCATDHYLFSLNFPCHTLNGFLEWFRNRLQYEIHDFYGVFYMNELIGYVYNYNFTLRNGRCSIVGVVAKEYRGSGLGVKATISFIDRLFRDYPLRKIYTSVYEYNIESLNANTKAGLICEGRLKESKYYQGRYWDTVVFSVEKKQFYEKFRKWIEVRS